MHYDYESKVFERGKKFFFITRMQKSNKKMLKRIPDRRERSYIPQAFPLKFETF